MDPDACLKRISDASTIHSAECREACEDLRGWIVRGGFHPDWNANPKGTKRYRKVMGLGEDLR